MVEEYQTPETEQTEIDQRTMRELESAYQSQQQFPETDVSNEFSMVAPEPDQPPLTASILAAHEGRREGDEPSKDVMDLTLNATRNSNSFEDGPNQAFPQTAETFIDDDLSRAEESKRTPYGRISMPKDQESKDDIERDSQSGALPPISE